MQAPLQIDFHQLAASPALEEQIRASVADFETSFARIVSCRVSVDAPAPHHRHGHFFHVRIEIGVPGQRIVVGGPPDEHPSHTDPHAAVHDAFKVARRRLEDHGSRQRDVPRRRAGLRKAGEARRSNEKTDR